MCNICKAILVSLFTFVCLFANSQSIQLENNSAFRELIAEYFYWDKDEEKSFSELDMNTKVMLLYAMIDNPKENHETYFVLFNRLLDEIKDLKRVYNSFDYSPVEYALVQGEPVPAKLLYKKTGYFPKSVMVPSKCDFMPVSSLYLASEMEDYTLIKQMIEYGIKPDSICYDYWLHNIKYTDSYFFFKEYHDTNFYSEKGNILNYYFPAEEDFQMDIPVIRDYNTNYERLIERLLINDLSEIDKLFDRFISMHLKYEATSHEITIPDPDNPQNDIKIESYKSDKLSLITAVAIIMNNTELLTKLNNLPVFRLGKLFYNMPELYFNSDIQNWLIKNKYLTRLDTKHPVFQVLMIANGLDTKDISANTLDFLLAGGSANLLVKFYASDKTDSPEIFQKVFEGDKKAIINYINLGQNPFISDNYGLSLFDALIYTGMEDQISIIASR